MDEPGLCVKKYTSYFERERISLKLDIRGDYGDYSYVFHDRYVWWAINWMDLNNGDGKFPMCMGRLLPGYPGKEFHFDPGAPLNYFHPRKNKWLVVTGYKELVMPPNTPVPSSNDLYEALEYAKREYALEQEEKERIGREASAQLKRELLKEITEAARKGLNRLRRENVFYCSPDLNAWGAKAGVTITADSTGLYCKW